MLHRTMGIRSQNRRRESRWVLALCLALALLLAAVFGQMADHPFVSFDDNIYVSQNPFVQDGLTRQGLVWAFTTRHAANWHPLTWLSHMVDATLFGADARPQHLTSLALHTGSTLVLFLALRGMTGLLWPSLLVAALFGIHPQHVESVAWIAERKDVLSGFLWMATTLTYVGYVQRPNRGRYVATLGLFALGLLAKPMLVTLPLTLFLLDAWPLGRMGAPRPSLRRAGYLLLEKAPLLGLALASSLMTVVAQRQGGAVVALWGVSLPTRFANALVSYVVYLQKTVWPEGLAFHYPYAGRHLPGWRVAAAALLLALVTATAVTLWRRRPYLAVGWFWYLGTLVPVIGLVQVGIQGRADRYSYVPLVGIFLALAWALRDLGSWRRAGMALGCAAAALVAALSTAACHQVGYWRDDQTLFGRTIDVTGENWLMEMNFGVALYKQGRYAEAVERLQEAQRLSPVTADIHYNLGLCYAALGRTAEAVAAYATAVACSPGDPDIQNNYGVALLRLGRPEEALLRFREAVRIRPDDDIAHQNIAVALQRLGRIQESAAALARARRVREERRQAHPSVGAPP